MKAKDGLKIGKMIGEGLAEGLEVNFKAGERQVKGVPLNLQLFRDDAIDAVAYGLDSIHKEALEEKAERERELYRFQEKEPLPFEPENMRDLVGEMEIEQYIQLVEFQRAELDKLKRERDLWEFTARMFFDHISDTSIQPKKDK